MEIKPTPAQITLEFLKIPIKHLYSLTKAMSFLLYSSNKNHICTINNRYSYGTMYKKVPFGVKSSVDGLELYFDIM